MTAHQAFNLGMAVGGGFVVLGYVIGQLLSWVFERLLERELARRDDQQ